MSKFLITRKFINGNLKGLTITQECNSPLKVGMVVEKPCAGGSGYIILKSSKKGE